MLFKEDKAARAEHQAVRENAGWYRWTHDLVEVTGKDQREIFRVSFCEPDWQGGSGKK